MVHVTRLSQTWLFPRNNDSGPLICSVGGSQSGWSPGWPQAKTHLFVSLSPTRRGGHKENSLSTPSVALRVDRSLRTLSRERRGALPSIAHLVERLPACLTGPWAMQARTRSSSDTGPSPNGCLSPSGGRSDTRSRPYMTCPEGEDRALRDLDSGKEGRKQGLTRYPWSLEGGTCS